MMSESKKKMYQAETPNIPALKANKPARKGSAIPPTGLASGRQGSSNRPADSGQEWEEIVHRLIEYFSKD